MTFLSRLLTCNKSTLVLTALIIVLCIHSLNLDRKLKHYLLVCVPAFDDSYGLEFEHNDVYTLEDKYNLLKVKFVGQNKTFFYLRQLYDGCESHWKRLMDVQSQDMESRITALTREKEVLSNNVMSCMNQQKSAEAPVPQHNHHAKPIPDQIPDLKSQDQEQKPPTSNNRSSDEKLPRKETDLTSGSKTEDKHKKTAHESEKTVEKALLASHQRENARHPDVADENRKDVPLPKRTEPDADGKSDKTKESPARPHFQRSHRQPVKHRKPQHNPDDSQAEKAEDETANLKHSAKEDPPRQSKEVHQPVDDDNE